MNTKLAISGHIFNSLESFRNPSPFPGHPIKLRVIKSKGISNLRKIEFTEQNFERIILENLKLREEVTNGLREINQQKKKIIELYNKVDQKIDESLFFKLRCVALNEELSKEESRSSLTVAFRKEAIV